MKAVLNAFGKLQKIINGILAFILALMMCVVFLQTFTRYIVFHSIPWSEELSRFLFVGLIVIGMNIGISQNMLVRIDIVDNYLNKTLKRIAETIRLLIGLIMNAVFAYSCLDMIKIGQMQKSPSMQIPMSMMYIIVFVGFILATVAVLLKIAEQFMSWRKEDV